MFGSSQGIGKLYLYLFYVPRASARASVVGPFCPVGNIVKSLVTNQDGQALGYTIIGKQSKIGISVHYWAKTKLNLRQPVTEQMQRYMSGLYFSMCCMSIQGPDNWKVKIWWHCPINWTNLTLRVRAVLTPKWTLIFLHKKYK